MHCMWRKETCEIEDLREVLVGVMIVKKHVSNRKLVLAVCDSEILGRKFEEGDLQLDLTSNFYKGEEKKEEELLDLLKRGYVANIVGEKSIEILVRKGIIKSKEVKKISGVPYTQVFIGVC